MRTVICLFSLFALVFHAGFLPAQFSLAASGGLNVSESYYTKIDLKTSPALHYFVELRPVFYFGKKWNAGVGLQYSVKGHSSDSFKGIISTEQRLQYLDFLPIVEFSFLKFMSVFGGVNVGLKLTEEYRYLSDWEKTSFEVVKPVDLGGVIGLRGRYRNVFMGIHFNHSLLSAAGIEFTDENGEVIGKAKELIQNFQIGLGYEFAGKSVPWK